MSCGKLLYRFTRRACKMAVSWLSSSSAIPAIQPSTLCALYQCYWLHYHPRNDLPAFTRVPTSLIWPTPSSTAYASSEGLVSFRRWIRIHHADTYIFGPFDFPIVGGRQSCARIPRSRWEALLRRSTDFANPALSVDLPDYSVHLFCFHEVVVPLPALVTRVVAVSAQPHPF